MNRPARKNASSKARTNARTNTRKVAAAAAITALVAGGLGLASAASASASADDLSPLILKAGQTLPVGATAALSSPNAQYTLRMQSDGNLVEYGNGSAVWSSHTSGNPGAYFTLQADDNAVVYSAAHKALWSSGTAKTGDTTGSLSIGSDGHVDIFSKPNVLRWQNTPSTNTLTPVSPLSVSQYLHIGNTELTFQSDGNLVDYVAGKAVWSSRTNGHPDSYAVFQADGNFVVYEVTAAAPKALWSTHTAGTKANRITLAGNGQILVTRGATVLVKLP